MGKHHDDYGAIDDDTEGNVLVGDKDFGGFV